MTEYDAQAKAFLDKFNIEFRATIYPSDMQEAAPWSGGEDCGLRYRVTISRTGTPSTVSFDYWGSINDREIIEKNKPKPRVAQGSCPRRLVREAHPSAYDVLSCVGSDINCSDSFMEFCGDFGYDEDSRRAYAAFERCSKFARELRDFFTPDEITELAEIQ